VCSAAAHETLHPVGNRSSTPAKFPLIPLLYNDGDLEALAAAWAAERTFAWVSRRSGVDEAWLCERLALLPVEHQRGRFVLLTSGSTGLPKLVVGDKRRTEALAKILHGVQDLASVEQAIAVLPLTYTYAFVNQWVWSRCFDRPHLKSSYLEEDYK